MQELIKMEVNNKNYFVAIARDKNDKYGNPVYRVNFFSNNMDNINNRIKEVYKNRENNFGLRIQSYNISTTIYNMLSSI